MERAADRLLVQPLGKALLEGRISEGAVRRVNGQDDALVFGSAGRK